MNCLHALYQLKKVNKHPVTGAHSIGTLRDPVAAIFLLLIGYR